MPSLTVFIDEGGDPGVKDGLKYGSDRYEWLTIAACVMRHERSLEAVGWIENLREIGVVRQSKVLHYARLNKSRRLPVCQAVAALPIRAFCVASNKTNMRDHINKRLGKLQRADQFYNWCVRLLLERVTAWAEVWHKKNGSVIEPLEVIFAHRGGHDYDHMFSYFDNLRMQIAGRGPTLAGMGLKEPTLDRTYWSVIPGEQVAGCQLADTIASAVYQAANQNSPNCDEAPARALRKIFGKGRSGSPANAGMTVWPLSHQAPLPEENWPFFQYFGHSFK